MTTSHPCRPTATVHHLRQPGAFELPEEEHTMPRNYYVAELLGVLPVPLPLALAEELADTLAIDVDEIGACPMHDSEGASCWGVFRVHMTARNKARAEVAALWLARELGDASRACILGEWKEPAAAFHGAQAPAAGARRAGGAV